MLTSTKKRSDGNLIFKITNQPSAEPVTVAEVKEFARIDTSQEDDFLSSLITAIRSIAEIWMGRALINQEITAYLDWWPETGVVQLPRPPLISVLSIHTINEAGTESLYSNSNYYVILDKEPGEIVIKSGCSPPTNTDRFNSGYRIIYEAGYGDLASDVPQTIKTGLLQWITHAYENRVVDREPPDNAMPLLGAHKINRI